LQMIGCKSKEKRAVEYNDQAIDMMLRLLGDYPADSLLYMRSLLEKAIELDPNNDLFYTNLAQNYIHGEMVDSAVYVLEKRFNTAKTSYSIPFWLGMYYDIQNDTTRADYFYKETYRIYNHDFPDTTDIMVLIDKKFIEMFMFDSVDFIPIENHPNADDYQYLIEYLKNTDLALSETSLYEQSLINENKEKFIYW
ncbi:MAG: hypothetical protein R3Y51_04905, partial [Rikenellaceae bacterium]